MKKSVVTLSLLLVLSLSCSDDDNPVRPSPRSSEPVVSVRDDFVIRVPSESLTIQGAIDLAQDGDTILLAGVVFRGDGYSNLDLSAKSLVIRSEEGPTETFIDMLPAPSIIHPGWTISGRDDGVMVISGITFVNGRNTSGGVLNIESSDPMIEDCQFINSRAVNSGGAVRVKGSTPVFRNCTFVGNRAPVGGSVYAQAGSRVTFENCQLVFGADGLAVELQGSGDSVVFSCCDIYGNYDGDWVGPLAKWLGVDGNFSANPLYCAPEDGDLSLHPDSPCLPENSSCGVLVGALPAGTCGAGSRLLGPDQAVSRFSIKGIIPLK